jgi:hypothetical protein
MQKNNYDSTRILGVLALIVVVIWCYNSWYVKHNRSSIEPELVTADIYDSASHLENIKLILPKITSEDKDRLSKFYKAFANVVQNDDRNLITHSTVIKEINSRAGVLCFGNDLVGKYVGLSDEIDGYIRTSVSIDKEHRAINSTDRKKIVNALNELSNIFNK